MVSTPPKANSRVSSSVRRAMSNSQARATAKRKRQEALTFISKYPKMWNDLYSKFNRNRPENIHRHNKMFENLNARLVASARLIPGARVLRTHGPAKRVIQSPKPRPLGSRAATR